MEIGTTFHVVCASKCRIEVNARLYVPVTLPVVGSIDIVGIRELS